MEGCELRKRGRPFGIKQMAERQYLLFWLLEKWPGSTITGSIAGLLFFVEWIGVHDGELQDPKQLSEIWWHLPVYWIAIWTVLFGFGAVTKLISRD